MGEILGVIYVIVAWKAMNYLWWDNHTYIFTNAVYFYVKKLLFAAMFGFVAIPIAGLVYLVKR